MEIMYVENTRELRRELKYLEKELQVKLLLEGKKLTMEGDPLKEYEARLVIEAISFGFSARNSIILKSDEAVFRVINVKDFTRRKNLQEVKGRVIGTHGQTKNTIEDISGCSIILKENEVGVLGYAENIEYAIQGISNIIKGSKQSNVYKYLEKINRKNKKDK